MGEASPLDAIGVRHGTDKSSLGHDYLSFYENYFSPLRTRRIKLLEIGVANGASVKMWEEYFPEAEIIGVDVVPTCKQFEGGRIAVEIVRPGDFADLARVAAERGPFDIVIEDASHRWNDQIQSLKTPFPHVKPGGVYIVEDLHTNYGKLRDKYRHEATVSCVDFLKEWLDLRVGDNLAKPELHPDPFLREYARQADVLVFYRRACLLKRAGAHI